LGPAGEQNPGVLWQGVVMIDLQVDFFNDPELERCRGDLVAACNRLVDAAIERGLTVIEVRTVHAADQSTWALNMRDDGAGMTIAGTAGAEPVEGLRHAGTTEEIELITKTRDNAFYGTALHERLQSRGVSAFLLCGVSTESCIAATATEAYARDFRVGIVLDATASVRWELHDHAIASLRDQYRQPALYAQEAIAAMAP
jgi:nicotinamidase-related amidase